MKLNAALFALALALTPAVARADMAPPPPVEPVPAPAITVEGAHVRLLPPSAKATGAFMVLKNASAREIKLTSASNPASKTTELHTHVNEGGVMKMRPVPFIAIPAGGEAVLKPGSLHVMLIDLLRPLTEGESVAITLNFDDGTTLVVDAPVKRIEAPMPGHAPKKP